MSQLPTNFANTQTNGFPVKVFLVDDQTFIGESVKKLLENEKDIQFKFCQDPSSALRQLTEFQPTVILQDLVMPDVDGLMMVRFYKASPTLRDIPLIVLSSKEDPQIKAEAFALGANDFLVKLPDKIELVARIRYHSSSYIRLLERNQAYTALAQSRQLLAQEIQAAAKYLSSLLPIPCDGEFKVDWGYYPCSALGGDTFGYAWIDENHFSIYMVDVTGHGMASALLAVSIMNILRSKSLPDTDFKKPDQVLSSLNHAFPSENYGDKFFTIWYGVINKSTSLLHYASGGHPPAILFQSEKSSPIILETQNPMMGLPAFQEFTCSQFQLLPGHKLYIYTDGCHEIHKPDGTEWQFQEFVNYLSTLQNQKGFIPELLHDHAIRLHGPGNLDDDFSILEVVIQ